jgi:4'-phosphopantetheinyl transferase EntD
MASSDDEQIQRINDALLQLTRRCAGLHVACVGEDFDELLGIEAEIAAEFTEFKRAELARGRTAARNVLAIAGMTRVAIGASESGLPVFPDEIVGSISHKHQSAIAVAVRRSLIRSIGVDLEYDDERDEEDLLQRVCTDSERAFIPRLKSAGYRSPATWIHSAKEAAYKAHFAVGHPDFDYDEIELSLHEESSAFQVVRIEGVADPSTLGLYARSGPWLISLAILAR